MPDLELEQNVAVKSRVVFAHGQAVGIIDPSVILGQGDDGSLFISGSNGVVKYESNDTLLAPLIACGGFLQGTPDECADVEAALSDETTSRTVAWICSVSTTCAQVINALNKIQNSAVLVVGCGGIGSLAALQLAGAGIRKIGVIDPDIIEESNLNRQFLWRRSDIGNSKVKVFARELIARYPRILVEAEMRYIEAQDLDELSIGWDAIIVTADTPIGILRDVVAKSLRTNVIMVTAGYRHQFANCTLWGNTNLLHSETTISWNKLASGIMPSVGPTNVELAGIAAGLVLRKISGISQDEESVCIDWDSQNPFRTRLIT